MNKHPRIDRVAVIFGLVSAVAVLALIIFLISNDRSQKEGTDTDSVNLYDALTNGDPTTTTPELLDPNVVAKKYADDVRQLVAQVTSTERNLQDLFTYTQDRLLSMRVPQPMLDAHLSAVLALRSLEEKFKKGTQVTKDEIFELIAKLREALDTK